MSNDSGGEVLLSFLAVIFRLAVLIYVCLFMKTGMEAADLYIEKTTIELREMKEAKNE